MCYINKNLLTYSTELYAVNTAGRVPIAFSSNGERIRKDGSKQSDWEGHPANRLVLVIKPSGQVCICMDFKKLNENIKREWFILPMTDEILMKLTGTKVFTSLDAASGFWQIPLHPESSRLMTFITPFAGYCFKSLPFCISIAPEIFQRKI